MNRGIGTKIVELFPVEEDGDELVLEGETGTLTDLYCDNPACDLCVPANQVVAGPFIKRMKWQAKDGTPRHYCATCARAVAVWQAERH